MPAPEESVTLPLIVCAVTGLSWLYARTLHSALKTRHKITSLKGKILPFFGEGVAFFHVGVRCFGFDMFDEFGDLVDVYDKILKAIPGAPSF
jgi:hypothetical protein